MLSRRAPEHKASGFGAPGFREAASVVLNRRPAPESEGAAAGWAVRGADHVHATDGSIGQIQAVGRAAMSGRALGRRARLPGDLLGPSGCGRRSFGPR
jgi:hypothetical protein